MKTVKSPFKFKGGVHPDYNKELARDKAIEKLPLPAELVVSMSQHLGAPAKCVVKAGDFVVRGQVIGEKNGFISVLVRAPADGKVVAVEKRRGPAGGMADAVVIDTTAKPENPECPENSGNSAPILPPLDWKTASREELLKRVEEAGICGMGGAGFPTAVKLNPPPGKRCEYLILNGAECEPYLTADFRLMLERAPRIRLGVEIMRKILGMPAVRIAVEANKPEAIAALEKAFADIDGNVEIVVLPVLYPQGSEKHQIYATVGRVVPEPPALPIDVGCVVERRHRRRHRRRRGAWRAASLPRDDGLRRRRRRAEEHTRAVGDQILRPDRVLRRDEGAAREGDFRRNDDGLRRVFDGYRDDEDHVRASAADEEPRVPVFLPGLHKLRTLREGVPDEPQLRRDIEGRRGRRHRVRRGHARDVVHRVRRLQLRLPGIPDHHAALQKGEELDPRANSRREDQGRRSGEGACQVT